MRNHLNTVRKKEELSDFNNIQMPKFIYKYRDWDNPNHRRILTHKELFFASPKDFHRDDSMDCRIPIRLDLLTSKDKTNLMYRTSKLNNTQMTESEHKHFSNSWRKSKAFEDPKIINAYKREYFNDLDNNLGVLSLTYNPFNVKMWEQYANNHQGICVGFNTRTLLEPLGGGGRCNYFHVGNEPKIIPMRGDSLLDDFIPQVFSKRIKYQYENEYRVIKLNEFGFHSDDERRHVPNDDAFLTVILGQENQHIDSIREIIHNNFPNREIHLYRSVITSENEVKLKKVT